MKMLTKSWLQSEELRLVSRTPYVSSVIPVYNEEPNLRQLHDRLCKSLDAIGKPWEVIYIDDGSSDRSLDILTDYANADPRVRVIEFNRNYGQHAAVFAGLTHARGEIVVTLDADLQNPPEEIAKLVAKMEEGYDVVGTRRRSRRDPLFRRVASWIVNCLTGGGMSDYGCMLRAYRREVVEQLRRCREISSFIPVLANQFAKRTVEIDVEHADRVHGRSKYDFFKLISVQFDLMTGFSLLPLRAILYFGAFIALVASILGLFALVMWIVNGSGWAMFGVFTLFVVLFVMVGLLFVALGVLGEYVGRTYAEVRQRPRYVIRKIHGGNAT